MSSSTAAPASPDLTVQHLANAPRRADGRVDLEALVDRCGPGALALLEAAGGPPAPAWSYVVPEVAGRLVDDGRRAELRLPDAPPRDLGTDPLRALDAVCAELGLAPATAPPKADQPELTGGLVGWFAYELGGRIEPRAARGPALPAYDLAVAEHIIAVDHRQEEAWLVARDLLGRGDVGQRGRQLLARLARPVPARSPVTPGQLPAQVITSSLPRRRYEEAVQRIRAYIAAGDVFQVNLTRQLVGRWPGDALDLYRALRRQSPAPLGALLRRVDGSGVASISPETFLEVRGDAVRARPIKGTRPREDGAAADAAAGQALWASAKDRAENIMIVDLLRNDLGRVCRHGSVRAPELLALEAHPTVWHLVSTITGRLRAEVGWAGLMAATFPCGSVTGAPKIRAMQIIAELEPVPRGVYCGAIGFLSVGAARLSVAIRTATLARDGRVAYGAGGAVVADSDPAGEHQESLDKAAAFLQAVRGRVPV